MRTEIFSQQGMKKLMTKPVVDKSISNYHAKAQAFIKDAKSKAMDVSAEDGELIASPMKKAPMEKMVSKIPSFKYGVQTKVKKMPMKSNMNPGGNSNGIGVGP